MDKICKYIKDYRLWYMGVCIIFIVCAAIYHYGLLSIYPLDAEDIMSIAYMYTHLNLGTKYPMIEYLYALCAYIATVLGGGITYTSVRLLFTLLYTVLMCGILYLCLQKKEKNAIVFLPLIAWFAVFLLPASEGLPIFQESQDLIYLWPFIYHYPSRIYTLFCLAIVDKCLNAQKGKKFIWGITALVIIYAVKYTDLIFLVTFVAPAGIVLMLHTLYSKPRRKWLIGFLLAGMMAMLVSKMMPGESMLRSLWASDQAHVYGAVYGGTNWTSISLIGERLLSYIELNFTMFDIRLAESPVISLYTVLYVFKLMFVCVGYVIIFHIIESSIWRKEKCYDYIDEVLAWAYVLLSLIYIFTGFGGIPFFRYFPSINTIMTVLLCRHLESLPNVVHLNIIKEINHKKVLLAVSTLILCLCSVGKVWTYAAPDEYSAEMQAMAEYIQRTNYGYAVSTYWAAPRVSVMGDGTLYVCQSFDEIKSTYGEDAKCAYIITRNYNNPESINNHITYPYSESYEEICEHYSVPSDVFHYNKLMLIVFEDGL